MDHYAKEYDCENAKNSLAGGAHLFRTNGIPHFLLRVVSILDGVAQGYQNTDDDPKLNAMGRVYR